MGRGLADYRNKLKTKKEEEEKIKSPSESTTKSSTGGLSKFRLERTIGLDTLESDLNSLGKTIQGIYDGWQTEETMRNTRSAIEAMHTRLGSYQEYQKTYGGADLSEIASKYQTILGDWDDRAKLYGQYKDADSYTKEKTKISELDSMSMEDIEPYLKDKKNHIAYTTVGGQDITWQSLYDDKKHTKMSTSKEGELGYEEFIKSEKETKEKAEKEEAGKSWWQEALGYLGTTPDTTFPGSEISVVIDNKRNDNSYQKPNEDWTQEELNTFGAYWYEKDYEGAYDYAAKVNNAKALETKNSTKEKIESSATSGFGAGVGHWVGSILTAPFGMVDYLDDLTDIAAGRDVIVEEGMVTPFEYSQTVNSSQSTALNDWSGTLDADIPIIGDKGVGDIYGLGTSIVNSKVSALTMGAYGTLLNYFGQAAASGVDDALSRGATGKQALTYGTALGLAEGIPEMISADKFLKLGKASNLGFLGKVRKQAREEGTEELVTALLGNLADNAIMQEKSAFNSKVSYYTSRGLEESDAKDKAWLDFAEDIAYDALGGYISGGLSAAPMAAISTKSENDFIKKSYGESTDELISQGLESGKDTESYKLAEKAKKKVDSGKELSVKEINQLVEANDSAFKTEIKTKAESRLAEHGSKADNSKVAEIIAKKSMGEKLTDAETKTLENSEYGNRVYNEVNYEELMEFTENMSESDANLFIEQYDGQTDVNEYADSFNLIKAYSEQKGSYFQDMALENRGVLTAQQVGAIYTAKRAEVAIKRSEESKKSAQAQQKEIDNLTAKWGKTMSIQGEFDDSVIDYNSTTTDGSKVNWDSLTPTQRNAIKFTKLFSKATGVNVRFIKNEVATEGEHKGEYVGKNGSYDPSINTIEIDVYAGRIDAKALNDTIIPTLSHEMTHWMKYKMPAIYNSIREDVLNVLSKKGNLDEQIGTEIVRIQSNHSDKQVTEDEAIDELVARACEDMLSNSSAARKLMAKMSASEQRSFIEKAKETFDNIIKWINDLLAHYKSNSKEAKILREYKQELKKISKQWDEMLISSISANQALQKEGITGEELAKSVDKDVKHSHRNVEKGKKRVYNELNSLAMNWANSAGIEQGDYNSLYDSKSHKWCLVVADKNSDGGYRIVMIGNYKEVKELEQIYNTENDSFDRYAETYKSIKRTSDNGLWESPNREMFGRNSKSTNSTQEGTKGNTSTKNDKYVWSDNRKTSDEIKHSDRDTLGNTLTEAQQSYFAESKVRDENGNLKVMYHGTPNATFTKFRSGTYFTEHKWYADNYQNQGASSLSYKKTADNPDTYAVYLDIKKPFDTRNKAERNIFYNEYYKQWGTGTDLMESGLPDWLDGQDLQEFLEEQGYDYDGLILDEGATGGYGEEVKSRGLSYVVFNPEQVKSVENKNPTKDADYRFSMRENVEETKDLVAVHNLSEEKLLKSLQLGGLPMPSIAIIRAREGHADFGKISLVFNKETIDPRFTRKNKVYSGDAWTPTYPRVDYKINEKAQESIAKKIKDLVPREISKALGGLPLDKTNMENDLNRHDGDLTKAYSNSYALKYAYAIDKGIDLNLPTTVADLDGFGIFENDAIIYVANELGKENVKKYDDLSSKEKIDLAPMLIEKFNTFMEEKTKIKGISFYNSDNFGFAKVDAFLYAAKTYFNKGLNPIINYHESVAILNDAIDQKDYENWIREEFSEVVEKEGLRNNKDLFTPSGNRRSFEALHYEHNLENVIKAMKETGEKGIGSFGRGSIFGAATTEYHSIAEIKEESQNRLQQMSKEEYDEIKKGFSDRFFELACSLPIHKDSFTATDSAANMLIEAVSKFKTKSGMANYLRSESKGWANYSDYVVDDLIELVNDIRQMPIGYFEAKPQRAVEFNEVATAIIPDSSSAELKSKLTDNGIKFVEYENNNEESRLKALNSLEDVKFSDRDTAYMEAVNSGDSNTLEKMVADAAEKAMPNSKVRDENGNLRLVYHGRVSEFNVFDRSFSSIEGDFGKGFYFTSNEYDVDANYANEEGSDLKNKIARETERLEWEDEYADLSYEEIKEIVRARMITSEPNTITAYLNMENPVYITPNQQGTFLDFNEEYDEEYDEYGEPEGLLVDFIEALNNNAAEYSPWRDVDFSFLYEDAYDGGLLASDAVGIIKRRIIDEVTDENGDVAVNEVIRQSFEDIGFDGIIDTSVYYKFRNMNGMDSGTTHYIVFSSNQIKEADLVTYDDNGNVIPLSQRFNAANEDIRYSDREISYGKLTQNRIDYLIEDSGAGSKIDYANMWVASINPSDFIDLTLSSKTRNKGREIFDTEVEGDYGSVMGDRDYISDLKRGREMPYLAVDMDTGKVTGHNGRHRMRALEKAGATRTPIGIKFYKDGRLYKGDYNGVRLETIDLMRLTSQFDDKFYLQLNAYIHDIIPLNEDHRSEIEKKYLAKSFETRDGWAIAYSDRDNVSVYDTMGETKRLIKENEQLKEDVDRLKERLKLERQITGGTHFNENQLNAVAAHIRNIAKSNYSKADLVNLLKGMYSYIATSKDLNWQDLFAQAYDIASMVLNEAKPVTTTNEYYKWILNDIRGTKISVNEQQIQNAKYKLGNKWRNAFFNKIKITDNAISLDSQWKEWSNAYPDLFDAEISPSDQLVELYDIYDSVKEGSEIVVEYDIEEKTRWLAREIYNQYWNVSPIRTTAEKYDKQIKLLNYKHKEAMSQLRNNYEDRLKSQHKADRQKSIKLVKEIRERKDNEIAEVKQRSKERMDAYKENAERKAKIQSITNNALILKKWLTTNSKDYHIHEALKEPVMKLLLSIDFSSKQMLEKNIPTQKDVSFTEAFASVKEMLTKAENMVAGLEELYGHDLAEDIDRLVQSTYSLIGDNNYVINKMSAEELKSLDRLVKYIKKVVTDLNKFHSVHHNQGAINLANEFVGYGDKLGKLKKQDGKIGRSLKFRNCTPNSFFKRLGEAGIKLFEAFQDGWDKLAFNVKEIIDFTQKTYTTEEVRKWSKETKDFTITQKDGKKRNFKMSIAQIMALHCVSKQEDAMRHLLSKGMTLSRVDSKGNVIAEYENITLTNQDIDTIISTLDKRAKEVADKLQEFMNTVCSDWGNAISMARFGIKMFTNPNYFPIKVSPSQIPTDNTKELGSASLFRLLNMSFTKSRNKFADQSIEIGDIFDIFAQHTTDMAKYNALALPVLDFNKFYSYTYADNTGNEYGVENTLRTVFGDESVGYIKRFIRDINGTENVSRDVIGKTFFKNAKLAAVANNIRVILLQPTAYVKASAVMDNKYLLKAKAYVKVNPVSLPGKLKKAIEKAEKHCGIIQWKALGYYDTDISKGIAEKVKHADSFLDKAKEKSMWGAEIADKCTFGTLWIACEFEIRDTRKDLKVNSEEFNQAVAKRLREIVYSTQVVDSTMTRSDMMRSADGLDKMLTTFGSEPILAYNMLMDTAMQYSLDKKAFGKSEAKKKNGKKIRKTITAYVMVNAVAALVESGFDAFRDDDDEEMDIAEFMKLYFKNFALDLSIGNKLPLIKEAYSIIQGYSSSRMDTQWMEYVYKLAQTDNAEKGIKYILKIISDLSGIAFYNIYRDLMATLYKLDILSKEDIEDLFD